MKYLKKFLTGLVIFVAGLEVGIAGVAFLFKVGVQMVANEGTEKCRRPISYSDYHYRRREP